jgi:hypothetical protein
MGGCPSVSQHVGLVRRSLGSLIPRTLYSSRYGFSDRVCSATSRRMHRLGVSKAVRSRHAAYRSSRQTLEMAGPVKRTPAAAHPRRRMSATARSSAALGLPWSAAICADASRVGIVVTVRFAPD